RSAVKRRRITPVLGKVRLDRNVDRLDVALARRGVALIGDATDGEDHDPGENAEDHDNDHELDQREAFFRPRSLDRSVHDASSPWIPKTPFNYARLHLSLVSVAHPSLRHPQAGPCPSRHQTCTCL